MQRIIRACLVAFAAGVLPAAALAQSCNTADRSVLLILDALGSMNAQLPNIVEVDGNKIPFPATEGEVLEIKPQ